MLTALSIRDIVLIEKLDLTFSQGLTVLTGETGAGKSILLDSLSLALGARADRALVRTGANQGKVIAEFEVSDHHQVCRLLTSEGIDDNGGTIILRRQITVDGRSRAWVNDEPVSSKFLASIGASLVEVHGQHDDRTLMEASSHRSLLDAFGACDKELEAVEKTHDDLSKSEMHLAMLIRKIESVRKDEEFLRHALDELDKLGPETGEEETLSQQRSRMMQGERLAEDLQSFQEALAVDSGVDTVVRGVLRRLERLDGGTQTLLEPVINSLDRAAVELGEATYALDQIVRDLEFDPAVLEETEERLFELRRLARKHNVHVDDLVPLYESLRERLTELEGGEIALDEAQKAVEDFENKFQAAVMALSSVRHAAANELDKALNVELPPLKLEKARFRTSVSMLDRAQWSKSGADRVEFEVQTNPSTPFGALTKIASGGEMARFILALKVVLMKNSSVPVMVFDEVDRGIGGATAAAVGERLSRLADCGQVLVVTHSPQVAARGTTHLQIAKSETGQVTRTDVGALSNEQRLDEVARMLSGATVTSEARAAAQRLLVHNEG